MLVDADGLENRCGLPARYHPLHCIRTLSAPAPPWEVRARAASRRTRPRGKCGYAERAHLREKL